jgi:acyl-coenzyme A thioesterase PaaI-like protein
MTVIDFLNGSTTSDGMRFKLGRELHGAFEGAFGGVIAAAALTAARTAADERRPIALDCRFLKGLAAGEVHARVETVREGRTVTVVRVLVDDENDDLCATADASFVNQDALHPLDDAGMVRPGVSVAYAEASPWQLRKADAPIVNTLGPRVALTDPGMHATVLQLPWKEAGRAAEAACLAADMSVGPPVADDLGDHWVPHPNPDLSLRFALEEIEVPEVSGVARLERIGAGVAIVRFEVFSGLDLIAVGCSSSVLLGFGGPTVPAAKKRRSG